MMKLKQVTLVLQKKKSQNALNNNKKNIII